MPPNEDRETRRQAIAEAIETGKYLIYPRICDLVETGLGHELWKDVTGRPRPPAGDNPNDPD